MSKHIRPVFAVPETAVAITAVETLARSKYENVTVE
jgi:hypothetical protein